LTPAIAISRLVDLQENSMRATLRSAALVLTAALTIATPARAGSTGNAVLGGVLGATAGAIIGDGVGGRDGAIVGGALGAALGAAVATSHSHHGYYVAPARPAYVVPARPVYVVPVAPVYARKGYGWGGYRHRGYRD
jgi:hypothetical protein